MPERKVLILDDTEAYPEIPTEDAERVDTHSALKSPDAIDWNDYAAVFAHARNDASDWADEFFEAGVIDGLFVFSGGEDCVSEYLGVFTLPRSLFTRRFSAFLERYRAGDPVPECATVFLAESFEESSSMPAQSTEEASEDEQPLQFISFIRPGDAKPTWCDQAIPLPTESGEEAEISVHGALKQLQDLHLENRDAPHVLALRDTYLNDGDGIDLLLHLRLDAEHAHSRLPVAMRLGLSLAAWLRQDPQFRVLATEGVTLLDADAPVDPAALRRTDTLSQEHHLQALEQLSLSSHGLTGRHDLANEWGPVQLWNGLQQLQTSDSEYPEWVRTAFFRLTRQRYYKYLFALSHLRDVTSDKHETLATTKESSAWHEGWNQFLENRNRPVRLGLIDDEASKGWTDAIGGVFADSPDGGSVDAPYGPSDFDDLQALADDISRRDWDAVLVDLRLTASDAEGTSRDAEHLSGVQLLRHLKSERPDLPVLAVTASNKAWTAKALRAAGADGYWIKESPEYGVCSSYTVQNAADLVRALHTMIQRYDRARPVWALVEHIEAIKQNDKRIFSFVPLTQEKDPAQIRKRLTAIQKRLRRAFGFLVMDPSDHEEEAFDLDRVDLAFLNVWSVLNEIGTLYFSNPPYRGHDLSSTPGEQTFRFLDPQDEKAKPYWIIEEGAVQQATPPTPSDSLEGLIRPTGDNGKPQWPGRHVDNPRVQWLLHRAGASDLGHRFHAKNGTSLRELRNSLEETHGDQQNVQHADLRDIWDLVDIWRAILPS